MAREFNKSLYPNIVKGLAPDSRFLKNGDYVEVCFNAKVQRPGVCNAMETMLVHEKVAGNFLPKMAERLFKAGE